MIRTAALILALAAAVSPALATASADWSRFVDPRSGAAVDVPPGFDVDRTGEVPGTGRLFRSRDGRVLIRVMGGRLGGGSLARATEAALAADQQEGWSITFRSRTPGWAAWSASRGGTILNARMILVCDGAQIASVRMTHPAIDDAAYEPVFERIGRSLAQDGGCY